jgi:hypothetical protein
LDKITKNLNRRVELHVIRETNCVPFAVCGAVIGVDRNHPFVSEECSLRREGATSVRWNRRDNFRLSAPSFIAPFRPCGPRIGSHQLNGVAFEIVLERDRPICRVYGTVHSVNSTSRFPGLLTCPKKSQTCSLSVDSVSMRLQHAEHSRFLHQTRWDYFQ